ncbi:hypothetical protein Sjap_022262 [Stephania japonica]|uniref:Uncharacterized protein n=1 Tax=Stephania japonica TaxID=461633 RepID=A0AAP0HUW2_9MAGN
MGSCCGRGHKLTVDDDSTNGREIMIPYKNSKQHIPSQEAPQKGKYDTEDEEDQDKSANIGKPKGGHEKNMSIGVVGAGAVSSNPTVSKDEAQQGVASPMRVKEKTQHLPFACSTLPT